MYRRIILMKVIRGGNLKYFGIELKKVLYISGICCLFLILPLLSADNGVYYWRRIVSPPGKDMVSLNIDSNQIVFAASWGDGIFRKDESTWKEVNKGVSARYFNVVESGFGNVVYASAWGNGLYFSSDKGESWTRISTYFNNLYLKCLSVGKNGLMIAGTYGNGVHISYSGGKQWKEINYGLYFRDINCLLACSDSLFYAGTNGDGVYRSTNAGSNWEQVNNGLSTFTITAIKKNLKNDIFLSTKDSGIYYSTDRGLNWNKYKVRNNRPDFVNDFTIINDENIFAATNNDGVLKFVPLTSDVTWIKTDRKVSSGVSSIVSNSNGYMYCSVPVKGIYFCNDGQTWSGNVYGVGRGLSPLLAVRDSLVIAGDSSGKLSFSRDFGNSWRKASDFGFDKPAEVLAADSSQYIFISTGTGLYKVKRDFSSIAEVQFFKNKNPDISAISTGQNNTVVVALNVDEPLDDPVDALFLSTDNGDTWQSIAATDKSITVAAVSPKDEIFYYAKGGELKKSTDMGDSWETVFDPSYIVNSIEFLGKNNIYVATDSGLKLTFDAGKNWQPAINYGKTKPSTKMMAVSQFGDIWCYLDKEEVLLYSSDLGKTWTDWSAGYVRTPVNCLEISPHGYLYLAASSLFRTFAPRYFKQVILSKPLHNDVGINHESVFQWIGVEYAELYQMQIADDPSFAAILVNYVTAGNQANLYKSLKSNTNYYWRARAKTNGTYGPWSETRRFTYTNLPGPNLTSPPDKSIGHGASVRFSWSNIRPPYKMSLPYHLQIAKDSLFGNIFKDTSLIYDTACIVRNLSIFSKYFWRVSASGTEWSETWSFYTRLAPPKLLEPLDSSVYLKDNVTLVWENSPGADKYHLQVSGKYDFSDTEKDIAGIGAIKYNVPLSGKYDTWFWRVKASNEFDESEWSEIFTFFTSSDSPVLIYPDNNSAYVLADTTFRWDSPVKDAIYYQLIISIDSLFKVENIVFDSNYIKTMETRVRGLEYGMQYWWRVRYYSKNSDTLVSAWSEVWKFRVDIPKVSLLSPPDDSKDIRPGTALEWNAVNCKYYYLQISEYPLFDAIATEQDSIFETFFTNTGLDDDRTYYWRVMAKAHTGTGEWSDTWSFRTRPANIVAESFFSWKNIEVYTDHTNNTITITTTDETSNSQYQLFGITGSLMVSDSFCGRTVLNLSGLSNGAYFLRINSGKEQSYGWFYVMN